MNVCFFGGRLVRDFEKRECADGSKVLTNSLAIKKSQDKTVFVDIAIFTTKLCEIAEKYLKRVTTACMNVNCQLVRKMERNMLVPWSKTSYSHKTIKRKRDNPLSFILQSVPRNLVR